MRAWISSEEDPATLLRVQKGFPELFTDKLEEGKTGPFPISHLRDLMNLYTQREQHSSECYVDPEDTCTTCDYYANLPDFPIPFINFRVEEISTEVWSQLEAHIGSTVPCEIYFPHNLHEIKYQGETFYLGCIDPLNISLVVKTAVHIDI